MDVHDFSIFVCNWGAEPQTLQDIIAVAQHAESLGFHSVQLPHVPILPYPHERPPNGGIASFIPDKLRHYQFDPLVLVPMVAQATKKIHIGFNIVVTGYLHPFIWAKYMATIDVASNGRLLAGFGLGYAPPGGEVIAMTRIGIEGSKKRGKMSDEALELITKLWTLDAPMEVDGEFFKMHGGGLVIDPKPIQKPYPELWWAGDSGPAIERAARFATYVEVLWPSAKTVREHVVPTLAKANEKWGRGTKIADLMFAEVLPNGDLSPEEISQRYYLGYKEDAQAVGSPETVAATIRRLRDAGVSHFALDMHRHGNDHVSVLPKRMDDFVEKVLPLLK